MMTRRARLLIAIVPLVFALRASAQPLLTYAGGGTDDGKLAIEVAFQRLKNVAVDTFGNVFVVDAESSTVRRIDAASGLISTVAGTGRQGFGGDGGPGSRASLSSPAGVAVDSLGNVYLSDRDSGRVRRVDAATGTIQTIAGGGNPADGVGDGGPATAARFIGLQGITLAGGSLYICESARVRRVVLASGIISTVAGGGGSGFAGDGGPATAASIAPNSVAVDSAVNLFIADASNNRIRRVDAATGVIDTLAGSGLTEFGENGGDGGPAAQARLSYPSVVALDAAGRNLYILDTFHSRIRKVALDTRTITTAVGGGGSRVDGVPATQVQVGYYPLGLTLDESGNIFFADSRVRKVTSQTGLVSTIGGGGMYVGDGLPAKQAILRTPRGLAIDPRSGNLLIADYTTSRVREVGSSSKTISTAINANLPADVAFDPAGNLYVAENQGKVLRKAAGTGEVSTFAGGGNPADGVGDGGPATGASLYNTLGIGADAAGNLYIAGRNRIRKVDAATNVITTVAGTGKGADVYLGGGFSGDGGPATEAELSDPSDVAVDAAGNLFISDSVNNRVRRVDRATGRITTVVGSGPTGYNSGTFAGDGGPATEARLRSPGQLAFDSTGNLYIVVEGRIRKVDRSTQVITTIAGNGMDGYIGDGGLATASPLGSPQGVAVDAAGNVYISELTNHLVRVIPTSGCALPLISVQPKGRTIISGFAAVLSVEASATGTVTYQWYRGAAGDTSSPISGATSPTFTTPPLAATTTYWVRVRNDCGPADSDSATVTVASLVADLSLTLYATPEPVPVGGRLTYTLTARNNGPTAATNVVVTDTLPAGVTPISSTASQGSCTGTGPVTCTVGGLVQGAEAKVVLIVIPAAVGTITNRARVAAAETDPDEGNNSEQRTSTVSPATSADVSVGQSASPSPARAGGLVTFTLFVANNGPAGAVSVSVTDTLPSGVTLVSSSALLGSCSGSGPVTCAIGSLAAGVSTTITLVVRTVAAGSLRNVATVSAAQSDPNTGNNTSSLDVAVLSNTAACPAPAPTILASPRGVVRAGDTFTVSWSDVYGPTDPEGKYRAELASSSDFGAGNVLRDLTTRSLSLSYPTASGAAATTLYFRIASVAGCGTQGAFSPSVSISVAPNPPAIVVTRPQTPSWTVAPNEIPAAATITFKNIGGAATPVRFLSSGSLFTFTPGTAILNPGEEIAVTLTVLAGSTSVPGCQSGTLTADWIAASVTQYVSLCVTSTTSMGSRPTVDQDEVLLVNRKTPRSPFATSESAVTITNSGSQAIFLVPTVGPGGAWLKLDPSQFATPLAPKQTRVLTIGSDPSKITPADYPFPIWTVLTVAAAGGNSTDRVQVKVFYTEETAVVSGAGRGFLTGGASSFIIPTAVHAVGAGATTFTSDGWLRNLSPDPVTFDVFATPSGQDGQVNALKVTQTIPGFSTVRLFDFIQSLFGRTDLAGAVEIRSPDAAQLSVRTTASGLPGTGDASSRYGTEIAVYGAGTGTGVGQPPLILTGIKDNAAYRLNLILAETTGTQTTVNLRLFDSDGNQLASKEVTVPALGNIQFPLIQRLEIASGFEAASLSVEPVRGTGRVVAIGTLIDNVSQSFQGLTGRLLAEAAPSNRPASAAGSLRPGAGALAFVAPPIVIPSIVHASGIGAYFTTELSITNATASPAVLHLVYGYGGGTATADVTLRGRASLPAANSRDAVVNLFGLPPDSNTAGSLRIEGPGVAQIVARATVSTPVDLRDPSKGIKGSEFQSYSALSREAVGIAKTPVVTYPGIQKYQGIRTNVILAEVSGQPARVRMRLINGTTGGVFSEVEQTFAAWGRVQINDIWNGDGGFSIGNAAFDKVSISLEPIGSEPGRVIGALSVIDNVTNSAKILVLSPPGPPQSGGSGF